MESKKRERGAGRVGLGAGPRPAFGAQIEVLVAGQDRRGQPLFEIKITKHGQVESTREADAQPSALFKQVFGYDTTRKSLTPLNMTVLLLGFLALRVPGELRKLGVECTDDGAIRLGDLFKLKTFNEPSKKDRSELSLQKRIRTRFLATAGMVHFFERDGLWMCLPLDRGDLRMSDEHILAATNRIRADIEGRTKQERAENPHRIQFQRRIEELVDHFFDDLKPARDDDPTYDINRVFRRLDRGISAFVKALRAPSGPAMLWRLGCHFLWGRDPTPEEVLGMLQQIGPELGKPLNDILRAAAGLLPKAPPALPAKLEKTKKKKATKSASPPARKAPARRKKAAAARKKTRGRGLK